MLTLALECISRAARARPLAAASCRADLSIRGIDDGFAEAQSRVDELFLYSLEENRNIILGVLSLIILCSSLITETKFAAKESLLFIRFLPIKPAGAAPLQQEGKKKKKNFQHR